MVGGGGGRGEGGKQQGGAARKKKKGDRQKITKKGRLIQAGLVDRFHPHEKTPIARQRPPKKVEAKRAIFGRGTNFQVGGHSQERVSNGDGISEILRHPKMLSIGKKGRGWGGDGSSGK